MALKRLVTGVAAIAVLGCSDGAAENASTPPAFSGVPTPLMGNESVDNASSLGQVPAGTDSNQSSEGAGVEDNSTVGQVSTEGQSSDDVTLVNSEESESAGSNDQADTASEGAADEAQTSDTEAPVEQEALEEPAVEEPEPIIRPALNCGAPPAPLEGAGVQGCDVNSNGTVNDQSWFLWYDGGSGCMSSYDNLSGAFTAQWNNPGDFLARSGFWFDETQTFEELGELGADMSFTKQGSAGGFSFIGIYGWTTSPLVEYYIVEDSYGNGPAQPFNTQLRGSFTADGGQYNVYSGTRNNQPSIVGTANFQQFFSVRQNPRECGHVSISEHFRQWQSMGMDMGVMYEAKILVEAGGGNGSITFDHANVTLTPPNN